MTKEDKRFFVKLYILSYQTIHDGYNSYRYKMPYRDETTYNIDEAVDDWLHKMGEENV